MAKQIYGVYDKKVSEYSHTFIDNSVAQMRRGLDQILKAQKSIIAEYPEDFDIYYLGEIDMITGRIKIPVNPEYVISVAGHLREMMDKMRIQEESSRASLGNTTEMIHKNIKELTDKIGKDLPIPEKGGKVIEFPKKS